jgi:hypothetical protein
MRHPLAFVLCGLLLAGPAAAQDDLARTLEGVLAERFAAGRAGDLAKVAGLLDKPARTAMELQAAALQGERLAEAKAGLAEDTPDSFTVESVQPGASGAGAILYATTRKAGAASEIAVFFVKEEAAWRIRGVRNFGDPALVERSPDTAPEPAEAFVTDRGVSLEGRIVAVTAADAGTVATVRIALGSADGGVRAYDVAVVLPAPAALAASGIDPAKLVPWTWLQIRGFPHKTQRLKILAAELDLA